MEGQRHAWVDDGTRGRKLDLSHGSRVVSGNVWLVNTHLCGTRPLRTTDMLLTEAVMSVENSDFFQSVSACVRTFSVLRGGLPEEKNISRCFSDFFPLLLFDFPLTPSPSKRAIFYCVLVSFYWNRN